jgi:hypothetical protein
MDRTENDGYNSSIVACVFVAAVTFLRSRCLAVEMGSGAIIYIPSLKDLFRNSKVDRAGIHKHTDSKVIA